MSVPGKDSVRFSDTSASPRFYGNEIPPYYGRPEEVSKDLLNSLQKGMSDLRRSNMLRKENVDPRVNGP
jgi:hypothetical protein